MWNPRFVAAAPSTAAIGLPNSSSQCYGKTILTGDSDRPTTITSVPDRPFCQNPLSNNGAVKNTLARSSSVPAPGPEYGGKERKKTKNMVGIFSRFSVNKVGHRRTQSALDEREVLPPNSEATGAVTLAGSTSATAHGIEIAVEFKPVEHPIEPLDNDRPIQCPLPEPSILNDGRIWKERVSAGARRPDLPVMQEGTGIEPEITGTKPRPPPRRVILPSISAPEHNILKLLEESGM